MTQTKIPTKRNYPPDKIDLAHAVKLRYVNKLSYDEIADHYGVNKSSVYDKLKKYEAMILSPEESEFFEHQETNIIRNVRYKILGMMTNEEALQKASINNLAYAQSQLFRDESILTNRPTDIYNSLQITANLEELSKRREQLLKQVVMDIPTVQDVVHDQVDNPRESSNSTPKQ